MTSKALEAAVAQISLALFTANDELRAALYEVEPSDDAAILDRTRRVIRAFAQNISEAAAIEHADAAARHCKDNPNERFVVSWLIGMRAAIEKDLE